MAGRFLLSGLAFKCKVLFKWRSSFVRSLARSVSILALLLLPLSPPLSSLPSATFYSCVSSLCAGRPWDKRLHFLIFKCAQTSYPAMERRYATVSARISRTANAPQLAAPRCIRPTCGTTRSHLPSPPRCRPTARCMCVCMRT